METENQTETFQTSRFHHPFTLNTFQNISKPSLTSSSPHMFSAIKPECSTPSPLNVAYSTSIMNNRSEMPVSTVAWSQLLTQFPTIFPASKKTNSTESTDCFLSKTNNSEIHANDNDNDTSVTRFDGTFSANEKSTRLTLPTSLSDKQSFANHATINENGENKISDCNLLLTSDTFLQFQKLLHLHSTTYQPYAGMLQQQNQSTTTTTNQIQLQMMQQFLNNNLQMKNPLFSKISPSIGFNALGKNNEHCNDEKGSEASSSHSLASSPANRQQKEKRNLQFDENNEAICPTCEQRMGARPAQWREHARAEREKLLQLIQRAKLSGQIDVPNAIQSAKSNSPPSVSLKRWLAVECEATLKRLRGNQLKRQEQLKQLLMSASKTASDATVGDVTVRNSSPTITQPAFNPFILDPNAASFCEECQRNCEFLVVASGANRTYTPPICLACFRVSQRKVSRTSTTTNTIVDEALGVAPLVTVPDSDAPSQAPNKSENSSDSSPIGALGQNSSGFGYDNETDTIAKDDYNNKNEEKICAKRAKFE